jgi:DNA-binding response OmpR family regulator
MTTNTATAHTVDRDLDRVLVVDDDGDIRTLIAAILSRAGYRAEAVDGGVPALAAAHSEAPELYVLDVNMPGMSGLDLCRTLKADHRTHAPVLMVSANATDEDIAAAYAAGADAYLPKPFTRPELLRRIDDLLSAAVAA